MIAIVINLLVFAGSLALLAQTSHRQWALSKKVMAGLGLGVGFGLILQAIYGLSSPVLKQSIEWFNVVGSGYVSLLQMIVMPLVFVSILSAVAKLHNASSLGKISLLSIGTLLFTTLIAALISVVIANAFHLSATGRVEGVRETARFEQLQGKIGDVSNLNAPQLILSLLPKNPFADLTGATPTSIIGVVIFSALMGVAALCLLKDDEAKGQLILNTIDALQAWVMKLVRLVMQLTPYGVLALMTKVVGTASWQDISTLGQFIVASIFMPIRSASSRRFVRYSASRSRAIISRMPGMNFWHGWNA